VGERQAGLSSIRYPSPTGLGSHGRPGQEVWRACPPGLGANEALALPALNPGFLYAALDATAYAAFVKESRKKRAGATKLHRKSGEAHKLESRLFHRALKRSFPRINAGASRT
jgi:hypothetical protein